jgi:hypothetical protein
MKLLTEAILADLPPIGSTDGADDPIVRVKFFTPDSGWTWYATEGGPENGDFIFFGYVVGVCPEWGYFSLSELQEIRGKLGLPVERDLFFEPRPFSQLKKAQ